MVQEFMHDDVPLAVITGKVLYVPPVLVELSVAEGYDLCEHIHPGVKHTVEKGEQANDSAHC